MDDQKPKLFIASRQPGQLASLAHEVNNQLGFLLNLLFLIKAEPALTENSRHLLELADEQVQRISQITHAALPGSRDLGVANANLPRLIDGVIDLCKPRFQAQGVSVATRYCSNGDVPMHAGPLRQLLTNLLLNAADAMPDGGRLHARVAKAYEWSGQHRHGLRITFADNGCGIGAEDLAKIFEPFFTTKGSGGSGLGLCLVKDVVQKHRGSLRVRSSTKRGRSGSIFSIFLPSESPARLTPDRPSGTVA